MAPQIHTYHCICSTLLLASTHVLSTLPQRSSSREIILPLPSQPPSAASPNQPLPPAGYTILHSLVPSSDQKPTIIRREDGFEKRILYRCSRCRVVVGYELVAETGKGKESEEMDVSYGEVYNGKVLYLLPGGIQSTEVMVGKEREIGEEDVGIGRGVAVFE